MEFTDHHVRRLVPLRFHVCSGLRAHEFRIWLPYWRHPYSAERTAGRLRCGVRKDQILVPTIVARDSLPGPFEALIAMAEVTDQTNRVERYLTIYRGYEAVEHRPDIDIAALRHSLAHSNTKLRDPLVVASLHRRFGSSSIDLRSYYHQKEFYCSLARMLIAIDQSIHSTICGGHAA